MPRIPRASVATILIILSIFLMTVVVVPITDELTALDSTFVVAPNSSYGPYDEGTVYHPLILGSSVLHGEICSTGGGIFLTADGHYTDFLKNIFILENLSFSIPQAHEQYTFLFNNTGPSSIIVHFTLIEIWTRPVAFLSPIFTMVFLGGLAILTAGILILISRRAIRSNPN